MLNKGDVRVSQSHWVWKTQNNKRNKMTTKTTFWFPKAWNISYYSGEEKERYWLIPAKTVTKTWGLANILGVFSHAFEVHPLTVVLKNVFKVCILFFWWITRISGSCLNVVQHKLQLKQRRRKLDENAWRNFECPFFDVFHNLSTTS